jgi:hypothetical protein
MALHTSALGRYVDRGHGVTVVGDSLHRLVGFSLQNLVKAPVKELIQCAHIALVIIMRCGRLHTLGHQTPDVCDVTSESPGILKEALRRTT